eukprot:363329-Chlamydomonas_euryale.AAC.9
MLETLLVRNWDQARPRPAQGCTVRPVRNKLEYVMVCGQDGEGGGVRSHGNGRMVLEKGRLFAAACAADPLQGRHGRVLLHGSRLKAGLRVLRHALMHARMHA